MNSYQISIKLQPFESDSDFDELVALCNQNQIQVNIVHEEMGVIKHCAFDYLIAIAVSPELWINIANGIISNVFYDSFKLYITQIAKKRKNSDHFNVMKIVSDGAEFIVEKETLSDELISQGLDAFKEIALNNSSKELSWEEMTLNKTIVFPNQETKEIETSSELEYIRKHVAKNKTKEDNTNE